MVTILDKNFDHHILESKWTKKWLESNIFQAQECKDKEAYVIMMPPPNVTGILHNGHALFVTLQDILARFHRMQGRDVLWLPGIDHAGIATQTVVDRELKKHENKSRHDLGRDEFLQRVFAWKDKHGNRIIEQLKLMGASADWSRLRFTMDEQCSKAVRHAFVKLWDEGLIYRHERLVNFDIESKTALSNEEVEHEDREGELCYFAYKIKDEDQEIVVATTRVETMLADVGVAVHPSDDRYQHLIGKELIHPFITERKLLVVGDNFVDKDFGSGAVKVTPGHDHNDFALAKRHNLPMINMFTLDAIVNENGAEFKGLDRLLARKIVKDKLDSLGLLRKVDNIKHAVAISQRSGSVIEPMLSRQYFVHTKPLAKKAYDAVNNGEVRIIPSSFKKTYDHFMLNIEDWCISRQLWWGHRIPIYYHIADMKKAIKNKLSQSSLSYVALANGSDDEAILRLALNELDEESIRSFSYAYIDEPKDKENYLQEEDVLDTWFSSGLWPFMTLGWPESSKDLQRYYPGSVLETGFDILFFWVARMMMFGCHFMKKPPFKDIFLHAMVRDAHGRKMSKSLGNAIDPIDVIDGISLSDLINKTKTYPVPENKLANVLAGIKKDLPDGIPSSGADGLRLSLCIFSSQGQNVKFVLPRVMGYRAFLNKVWNATRFCLMNIGNISLRDIDDIKAQLSLADQYIISRLQSTILAVENNISSYKFGDAAEAIYQFFWHDYCDNYIEIAKVVFKSDQEEEKIIKASVLIYLLDNSMRMLHPFCPFISEEIWQTLPTINKYKANGINFCAIASFPKVDNHLINNEAENAMKKIFHVATLIKNVRQSSNLPVSMALPVIILAENQGLLDLLLSRADLIAHMAKTSDLQFYLRGHKEIPSFSAVNTSDDIDVVVLLEGLIDKDQEIKRLDKALHKLIKQKENLQQRLLNKDFITHAPKDVIAAYNQELMGLEKQEQQLCLAQERLKG